MTFVKQFKYNYRYKLTGGEMMIEEAVTAVKKAEGEADELLRKAQQESAEIVKEAKEKAEALRAEALKQAEAEARARMEQARADGESLLSEEAEKSIREAEALKSLAVRSEEKAVDAAIAALLPEE